MRDMVVLINLDGVSCRSMARKLRAEHIYCKILPADVTAEEILHQDTLGILLAGPSTGEAVPIPHLKDMMQLALPLLAMGDAALTLCQLVGGQLTEKAAEPGVVGVRFEGGDPIAEGMDACERYLPACRLMTLPESRATTVARTDGGVIGFREIGRPAYGFAFQVEQNDTDGVHLMINFCRAVCGCTLWWSNQAFVERARDEITRIADGGEAVCALSGGVDSGVCALLGNMALGHRLHCIFVDTGLLRQGEGDQVMAFYRDQIGLNLRRVDAREEFLTALAGVTTPAEKEQIIFQHLRGILNREVARLSNVTLIIQGTNYSDTLQTGVPFPLECPADTVRMIEPVRELFKDEIRRVGEELGLPPLIIQRQPFPGSGLALRIASDVTEEKLAILREADAIFRDEIELSGQNKRLWQYFASLADNPLSAEAGGVIILRAVQVVDGASAVASRLPYDLLERVTLRIRAALPGVYRVMYDLTPSRNYAQVEWR